MNLDAFAKERLEKKANARAVLQQLIANQNVGNAASQALNASSAGALGASLRGVAGKAAVGGGLGAAGGGAYGAFANPESRLSSALEYGLKGGLAGAAGGGLVGAVKAPAAFRQQLAQNDDLILNALKQRARVDPLASERQAKNFARYYGNMKPKKEQEAIDLLSNIQF